MYQPKTHEVSTTVTMVSQLETIELEKGLYAFRLTQKPQGPVPAAFAQSVHTVRKEGFCCAAAISAFNKGKAQGVQALPNLSLLHKDLFKLAQQKGFVPAWEACEKLSGGAQHEKPYTEFLEGRATLEQVAHAEWASHMLFDRHGTILPVGHYCDYIEAHMHDGAYDLKKALAILEQDPRVTFVTESRHGNGSPIHDIPRYNRDERRQHYIPMIFSPTAEDAVRLWEAQKAYGTQYPSTKRYEAMFDLDILGLRAGGASRYDSFNGMYEND